MMDVSICIVCSTVLSVSVCLSIPISVEAATECLSCISVCLQL